MATHEGPHFFGATSASRQASASSTDPCARDPEIGKAPEIAQAEQGSKTRHPATRFNWRTDFPHTLWRPEEIRSEEFYRDIFVEYLGTLLFIFFALGAVVFTDFKFSGAVGKLGISFAFGLSIFAIVYSSAGISGGHINPAVTFAGRISALKGSLYIIAQMVGSICGAAIVHAVNKTLFSQTNGGANFVQPGYDKGDALGVEIIGTFVLITTVFAATDPVRSCREGSPHISALAPFAIGVAVFIVHLAIIPIDGTSINPARSFGPAVIYNKDFVWDDQWIFWVGPGIGALVAVFVYEWFIRGADFRSMQRKHQ